MTPTEAWERLGMTRHYGGMRATCLMLRKARIRPGMRVLEIGCGAGYTTSLLAGKYGARVTAVDKSAILLNEARTRATRDGTSESIRFMRADAEHLPVSLRNFDVVIAESVLALCNPSGVARQAYRALRPGGVFCCNELTYLTKPSAELRLFFSKSLGVTVSILTGEGWSGIMRTAGFVRVESVTRRISITEDFDGMIRIYGLWKFFTGLAMMLNPRFMRTYFKFSLLSKWAGLFKYSGYGIYLARKPATRHRARVGT